MKLLIVRHGEPDYAVDSLTEKGWALRDEVRDIPARVGECITLPQEEALELYKLLRRLLDTIEE